MKRKPYKKITVYNVVSHSVFIEDNKSEHHFTIDKNNTYFDWSDDLETKLKEYNELKFNADDINDADGIEKVLWCAEIPVKMWNKRHKNDEIHEDISDYVDYDFKILKTKYWDWEYFLSDSELSEYLADLKQLNS